tara:strand:- start:93 stop:392 length:300 start_codon:yes stop_codon:yes gene_type:complete
MERARVRFRVKVIERARFRVRVMERARATFSDQGERQRHLVLVSDVNSLERVRPLRTGAGEHALGHVAQGAAGLGEELHGRRIVTGAVHGAAHTRRRVT